MTTTQLTADATPTSEATKTAKHHTSSGGRFTPGRVRVLWYAVLCLLMLGGEDSHKFMDELVGGSFQGGGFFESIYRIVTHMNPTTPLPDNPAFIGMHLFDAVLTSFLWLCKQVIPRMQYFNMSEFVSNGFDVPWDASVIPCLLLTVGYLIPCVLLGYFALRIRELESK